MAILFQEKSPEEAVLPHYSYSQAKIAYEHNYNALTIQTHIIYVKQSIGYPIAGLV